jgi:hypothetical protein
LTTGLVSLLFVQRLRWAPSILTGQHMCHVARIDCFDMDEHSSGLHGSSEVIAEEGLDNVALIFMADGYVSIVPNHL